ncbi:LPS-assembly protein LptD [Oleiphilus messinensis]|uniref:LPS-assembly protein LptD n=1 Tax=Oleiphilus messinensis TaxID=141451 RepID=UPI0018DF2061|nr:LPS-assembly protein LptD [Oleiphilus messinensis]
MATDKRSAAELDWVPYYALTEAERAAVPAYCGGDYRVPNYLLSAPSITLDNPAAVHVSAKTSESFLEKGATLHGDVEVWQGNFFLRGDWATLDRKNEQAELKGNILLRAPVFTLTGEQVRYDMNQDYFSITGADYLYHANKMRGSAEVVESTGTEHLAIQNGYFTTCPPDNNDWALEAASIDLDRKEGFGVAKHAVFRIKDIPVAYFPYFSFPIDDRRKTGFLYPSIGTSNAGTGMYLSTPYYLNLAPNYDATIAPQYMHGRGLLTEIEGRYLNRFSYTEMSLGYIYEDDEFARSFPSKKGERWAFGFNQQAGLPYGFSSSIEVKAISDDDYLSDLNRTLNIEEQTHLNRQWQVESQGDRWHLYGTLQGYQTIDDTIAEVDKPYARLPEISFEFVDSEAELDYRLDSMYAFFYRDNDELQGADRVNGQRLWLSPSVSLPMREEWGFWKTAVRLDQTDYLLDDQEADVDDHLSRTVPFVSMDSGLFFDRTLRIGGESFSQSLEPRLFYVYSPHKDQSDYPDFDTDLKSFRFNQLFQEDRFSGQDRVGDNNRLTVAVTSRFSELANGIQRASISLGQIYYFEDRRVDLKGRGTDVRTDSLIAGEAVIEPNDWMALRIGGLWDARNDNTTEGSTRLQVHSPDYEYVLNIGHRYLEGELEQSDISAIVPIGDQVALFGRWFYELADSRTIGTVAGLEYSSCCWRVQVLNHSYLTSDQEVDNRLLLRFELSRLSGLTSGSWAGIDAAINGFSEREERMN